jgi:hypothetical protein
MLNGPCVKVIKQRAGWVDLTESDPTHQQKSHNSPLPTSEWEPDDIMEQLMDDLAGYPLSAANPLSTSRRDAPKTIATQ